ncbi:MAG TPA: GNAT family N-acetyltransferase [Gaiellaceae bacterium]|nr:GNAT family N-acetyltransferase [Gaiellaceae bacterium]
MSPARVEQLDAQTAAESLLRELYIVETEAGAGSLGAAPAPTFDERRARYRNPGIGKHTYWLARVGDEPAGLSALHRFGGFVTVDVLVRPSFRRCGIGSLLFERLVAGARAAGVNSFFGHHVDEVGAAFARKVGATDDQREVKSVLRLREAALPPPRVPEGVELRSWTGHVPDDIVASFVQARNALGDAPAPGAQVYPDWTVETQRADDQAQIDRGVPIHATAALEHGEVVALTGIRVGAPPCRYAATDDTTTVPHARGRGLAYAVKLENLRRLREERPDVELVGTMNAEQNAPMRAVNRKLGFVPTVTLTTALFTLGE